LLIISSNVTVYFQNSNTWSSANFALLGGELHQFFAVAVVPEPSVAMLWLSGLAALYLRRRRDKSHNRNVKPGGSHAVSSS
jgi:MYXO-CTERM domain-containing protein